VKPRHRWNNWFPYPVMSALIGVSWLVLQGSVSASNALTALLLGWLLPRLLGAFIGDAWPRRRVTVVLRLLAVLLWDIVSANIAVAWLVLWPRARPQPAWLVVPLQLRSPRAMAMLASIISITPGTVSCVVDEERFEVLVHALDCDDARAMVDGIKTRYEALLLEIFG
jgi:multicomponent K+:H+ antiporter subunit E